MNPIFGYFNSRKSTEPDYDPGLGALCPICNKILERPVKTISLMVPGDIRSYFYRIHAGCSDPQAQSDVENALIDEIYRVWGEN